MVVNDNTPKHTQTQTKGGIYLVYIGLKGSIGTHFFYNLLKDFVAHEA